MYFKDIILSEDMDNIDESAGLAVAGGIVAAIAAGFIANHIKIKRRRKKFYEQSSRELYNNLDVIKRSMKDYSDLHPEIKNFEDVKISSISNNEISKYAGPGYRAENEKDYKFMTAYRGNKSPENTIVIAIYDFKKRETNAIIAYDEGELPNEVLTYLVAKCTIKVGIYDGYVDTIVQATKTDDINQNAITYRNSNKAINKH